MLLLLLYYMEINLRVVPNLYCRGGDVVKDNGFGCFLPEGEVELMTSENFKLKHTVPGTIIIIIYLSKQYLSYYFLPVVFLFTYFT